ncbi:uncharacterized protein [Antedon mediterranea]|uniref:uncharacterized protein n=1 Tax=Antedon mediterranea TaxID=105859 RepID=UPI003AF70117
MLRCLIIIVLGFETVYSGTSFGDNLTCYNYDPNDTPADIRCPEKCNCSLYCKTETEDYYNHNVNCSYNQMTSLPSQDTIPTDVVFYTMSYNRISSLENNSFKGLIFLRTLNLIFNNLKYNTIGINAFRGLYNLRFLSMDKNDYLGKLLPWFDDLVSLEMLFLPQCGLTTIYPNVFNYCKNLIKVDLTRNSIKYIQSGTFHNLSDLKYLYLNNNKITSIAPQAFKGSSKLQRMSINDNLLSTITEDVGLQNLTQLQILNVAYNTFMCDCDLMWFIKWIGTTNVTIDQPSHTGCRQFPDSKEYKKILDFDPNKLHCSKLDRILRITIPSASAVLGITICGVLLYRYRFHLRYWNQQRRLRKQYQRICNQGPPPINGEDIRYDVFVCYNSKDIQWVLDVLQPSLEVERNFKLCVDYRDFLPGEAIVTNIANAVKFSRKVLLVVSKHFAKSEWCNFELEMARMRMFDKHEDILVVVLIEKVSPKDMPILLHKILTKKTYIEWEEHPGRQALFWAKLETALLSPNCPKDRLLGGIPSNINFLIMYSSSVITVVRMFSRLLHFFSYGYMVMLRYMILFVVLATAHSELYTVPTNCTFTSDGNVTCCVINPNGGRIPSDIRCPEKCECLYCKTETEYRYSHNVDCSDKQLTSLPLQDKVPTDAKFYILSNNRISSLENNYFRNFTILHSLNLTTNRLKYNKVEINAFRGLHKLTFLSMAKNGYLGKLLPWFDDLFSLLELQLPDCGLSTIHPEVFTHCKNLIKIDLTKNAIKYINSGTFQNLLLLKYLYLQSNKISSIPPQAFKGLSGLQRMTLNDNLLTTIEEDVGLQNMTQLQFLNVAYNKFSCDCNLVWFRKWIGTTNVKIQDISHTNCSTPYRKKILDFDPDKLHCSKLDILRITIPFASAGLAITICCLLLYRYRFNIRYWNQRRRLRKQYQQLCTQGPPPINGEDIRYDVFVCYNSNDQQWVLKTLQPSLEVQRNFKLCVDYRDFIPGEAIATNIANAVKFSRKVLLVVSKHFAKSEWCNFELEMTRMRMFDSHEDILVVVLIEKVSPKEMPILLHKILTTTTYIEWEEHPERQALFWAKLETALLSPNCPKDRLIAVESFTPFGEGDKLTCYKYYPNGTFPEDIRCPKKCNCVFCKTETDLYYSHNVYCNSSEITSIPPQATVPTDAKYYILSNNLISSLDNNSFKGLTFLHTLNLISNNLKYNTIGIDAFRGLHNLKFLSMDKNSYLAKLLPWFDDLVSLEVLHLPHCGLTTVHPKVFNHCKKLIKIDLNTNAIETILTGAFQNLPDLIYLFLDHNKITSIPPQAFKGLSRLQRMTLNDNLLTTIKEDVGLQNMTQLQFLNVAYNKFSCDCNLVWFRKWIGTTNVTIKDINNRTNCSTPPHSKRYNKKILDFDPDKLHCSKFDQIVRFTIPSASVVLAITIGCGLLYRYRFHLRYWNQRRRLRKQYQRIRNQGPPPVNGENIRYDVFVCYNSKDQQWVLKTLQPSLEVQRNFKLCVDYRDFIPGEAIATNIANAVKFSRKVLLVVSKHFAKSEWCNFELEMARMRMFDSHEDILVVVLIEKVSPKEMPILLHKILTTTTYIEWEEHPERQALFWTKLETALLSPNCSKDRLLAGNP